MADPFEQDQQELVPGVPMPQPQVPEQDSFTNPFEQQVLSQVMQTPEDILKKKMAEYYKNLGVSGTGFKSKLASGLYEINKSLHATKKEPYVGATERLQAEAKDEYNKAQPTLRNEAATIYANRKAAAQNASKEAIAKANNEVKTSKIVSDAKLKKQLQDAQVGNLEQKTAALKAVEDRKQKEFDNLSEVSPIFKFLPKDMQDLMVINSLKETMPDWEDNLQKLSALKNSAANPSLEKSIAVSTPDQWKQSYERREQLEKAKNMFKPKPQASSSAGNLTLQQRMRVNPETGAQEPFELLMDKKGNFFNPETKAPINVLGQKLNQKSLDTDRAAGMGISQGREGLNAIHELISNGQENKVLGPEAGNPFATFLRSVDPQGALFEEMNKNISTKNVVLSHMRTMFGGRFPISAADALERLSGKQFQDPKTQARAMASLVYSIENMRMINQNDPRAAALNDPRLVGAMKRATEEFIDQAYSNKRLGPQYKKYNKLPTLSELVDSLGPQKPQTNDEKLKANLP